MKKYITNKLIRKFLRCMEEYEINLKELYIKKDSGAIIIDVRSEQEYKEGNINGSINVPEYKIKNDITRLLKDKNQEIVVYCQSGSRSKNAYKKLKKIGYEKVYCLYGGLDNFDNI